MRRGARAGAWRRWKRFAGLSTTEKRLVFEASWLLMRARARLGMGSFQGALGWSERLASRGLAAPPRDAETVERLVRATERAALLVPGALCLAQALVARVLMARRGRNAELRLGVARDPARGFIAHAWLEWAGARIELGSETGRYTELR